MILFLLHLCKLRLGKLSLRLQKLITLLIKLCDMHRTIKDRCTFRLRQFLNDLNIRQIIGDQVILTARILKFS